MFLIQIALLHLNQLFKTVSRRSSTFSYLSPYLHTSWWKELFLKCLTPAFSHFVIPFHDSSPWFYGTVSKVQSASTPCQKWSQDLAGFHFAAAVVLLLSLSFKYLSEINFVARKAKYLSLAWLLQTPLWFILSDEGQKRPCLSSTFPDIFRIWGPICCFSVLLRHFLGFFSSLQCCLLSDDSEQKTIKEVNVFASQPSKGAVTHPNRKFKTSLWINVTELQRQEKPLCHGLARMQGDLAKIN